MDGRFDKALMDRINKMIAERSEAVIAGHCRSLDEYRGNCEAIRALEEVLAAMVEIQTDIAREATRGYQPSPVLQRSKR